MSDKLKYFIEAWEMNGVGKTVATVQDSPGTVVTITVDDLRALLARQPAAIDKQEAVTREEIERARDRILEQSKNSLFRSGVKICAAEILSPTEPCDKPPAGWTCSRIKGHEGPCAASPAAPSVAQDERGAWDGDSEESRAAFRAYDAHEPVSTRSSWQIWRDACAWQARMMRLARALLAAAQSASGDTK